MATDPSPQRIPLIFFRTAAGSEPVREWLKELPEVERRAIGTDLSRAQWQWPAGMPLCRPMGDGLWEVRTDLPTPAHCPRAPLPVSLTSSCIARVYQEDADDTRGRLEPGPQTPKGVGAMSKKHMGSSIDDFLKEEGIFEQVQAQAIKEVVAWQLASAMKKKKISKARMASLLKTSRTQVDRILDPKNDITLSSLQRAAAMVGRRVMIQLV
jgi:antitoxin HicB